MHEEQPACGKGLSAHAVLPETIGALIAAMAEVLQNHIRSLNLQDENVKLERDAYDRLAREQRLIASKLEALATTMRSYWNLPMAVHDDSALADQTSRDVFASFIHAEERLVALLDESAAEHRVMLGSMSGES